MRTLFIALLVYVLLDIIASIVLMCRAKKNGITLKDMAFMLKDFWGGYSPISNENKGNR